MHLVMFAKLYIASGSYGYIDDYVVICVLQILDEPR